MVEIGSWQPFFYFLLLVLIPVTIVHVRRIYKRFSFKVCYEELPKTISLYITKHSGFVTCYHLILSILLAAYFIQIILNTMDVAVDLSYYTKTSIKAYQVISSLFLPFFHYFHSLPSTHWSHTLPYTYRLMMPLNLVNMITPITLSKPTNQHHHNFHHNLNHNMNKQHEDLNLLTTILFLSIIQDLGQMYWQQIF